MRIQRHAQHVRHHRMRPRLLAEHRRVSGEAAILAPYMELIAGRTHDPETAAFELDVDLAGLEEKTRDLGSTEAIMVSPTGPLPL